jgi:hypothetical protein
MALSILIKVNQPIEDQNFDNCSFLQPNFSGGIFKRCSFNQTKIQYG